MRIDRKLLFVLALFLFLSVLFSWKSFFVPGNFAYRDYQTVFDLSQFKEHLVHLYKNYGEPNLDMLKRIPELWIHLIADYETYDKFRFALLAFGAFLSSFFVAKKILDEEGPGKTGNGEPGRCERDKCFIAFLAAFFYVVNPFTVQMFLRYYVFVNYAIFPVFFYSLYVGFAKSDRRLIFLSGLLGAFMFLMVVHTLLHIAVCLFVVALLCFRTPSSGPVQLARNAVLFGLVIFFSTAFVLFPYFYLSLTTGVPEGVHVLTSETLDMFSAVAYLPRAMLLDFHVFWWPHIDYEYPFGNLFFLVAFLFAGSVLVHSLFDRNRWTLASLMVLVLLFFFSKGNSPPFPGIYESINFMLPVFGWLLRVPVKFLYIIPFFFSVLFLRALLGAAKIPGPALYPLGALCIILIATFSWPFFSGDMAGYITGNRYIYDTETQAMNAYLGAENQTVMLFGEKDVSLRAGESMNDPSLNSDILPPGPFLSREMQAYLSNRNWSGLDSFSGLGVAYLVTNLGQADSIGIYSQPVFNQSGYSMHPLKNGTSVLGIEERGYLCYCNLDTARSVMRDPPAGSPPLLLMFPYEKYDFPGYYLNASDYVLLDSSPILFPSVEKAGSSAFFTSTYDSNPSRGWARGVAFAKTNQDYLGDGGVWNQAFEFGKGFVMTNVTAAFATAVDTDTMARLKDINLTGVDRFSAVNGTSVTKLPNKIPFSSLVISKLPVRSGGRYNLTLGIDVSSDRKTTIDVFSVNQYGDVLSTTRILSIDGDFRGNASVYVQVPYGATGGTLAISSTLSENGSSYNLTGFSLASLDGGLKGETVTSSFMVQADGEYVVHLYLLKSRQGGMMRAYLDGKPSGQVLTYGDADRLQWVPVYSGNLSRGIHTLSVESLDGFNAINILHLSLVGVPEAGLANKTFIYRLTGKNDFSGPYLEIYADRSSSSFYTLASERPVHSTFTVYREGEYLISSSLSGVGKILMDGNEIAGDSVYLSQGQHRLEILPENGTKMLIDQVTLISKTDAGAHPARIIRQAMLDPSTYSATVESAGPFWLVFGRGNDWNWVAWVNGRPYYPVSDYAAVNAYYISESGINQVIIEYEGQKWVYIGAITGLAGLCALTAYVRWSKA